MRTVLIIASALCVTSCSRTAFKQKAIAITSTDEKTVFVDTSKNVEFITSENVTLFGDTLNGSMFFPLNVIHTPYLYEDSIESNGIKIKVGIMPVNGGFKARVKGISKPVGTKETTSKATNTSNGIGLSKMKIRDSYTEDTSKKTSKRSWEAVVAVVASVLILSLTLYFGIKKHK